MRSGKAGKQYFCRSKRQTELPAQIISILSWLVLRHTKQEARRNHPTSCFVRSSAHICRKTPSSLRTRELFVVRRKGLEPPTYWFVVRYKLCYTVCYRDKSSYFIMIYGCFLNFLWCIVVRRLCGCDPKLTQNFICKNKTMERANTRSINSVIQKILKLHDPGRADFPHWENLTVPVLSYFHKSVLIVIELCFITIWEYLP